MPDSLVIARAEGACVWRTLNRPQKLNAFNRELAQALIQSMGDAIASSSCHIIVITSAGRAFSAGQDLEERRHVGREPVDSRRLRPGGTAHFPQYRAPPSGYDGSS